MKIGLSFNNQGEDTSYNNPQPPLPTHMQPRIQPPVPIHACTPLFTNDSFSWQMQTNNSRYFVFGSSMSMNLDAMESSKTW